MKSVISITLGIALLVFISGCQPDSNESADTPSTSATKTSQKIIPANDYREVKWTELKDVAFGEKYYEKEDAWMLFPTFGDSIKALEGKYVYISGHVIPLEAGRYVLSSNSFSSCFFCGGAGPESVMELELVDTTKIYFTDEFRTFQGRFRLNDSNIDRMNYILETAEPRE